MSTKSYCKPNMKINIKHLRTKASLLQETGENFRPHLYNNNMLALIHTCTHKNKKNKTKISTFASISVRKGV